MGDFLSRSNYSNWSDYSSGKDSKIHKKNISTGDHFFRTTKDNKNESKIGYTRINPLVTMIKTDRKNEERI